MFKNKISIIIILALISLSVAKFDFFKNPSNSAHHYAVLIAGSNGFWNYRHQSDIFHSYHILLDNGVPKENIIVMAFDDIANHPENPFYGQVFNKPDPKGKGKDVYAGVNIDYRGADVNPANFLAVIEGKKEQLNGSGSGRVLTTTEQDNIFIYFSDHGATGLIAFPSGELYADQLNKSLLSMHAAKQYKELVFYLEACESGSMFDKILANDIKIYTTTASNPNQSSWAIYCSPDDVVNNVSINTCLGDEYSVNWMEDSDNNKGLTESLQIQFQHIKDKTKNSEAHQYGDLSYQDKPITDYQGDQDNSTYGVYIKAKKYLKSLVRGVKKYFNKGKSTEWKKNKEEYQRYLEEAKKSKVDSREAKLRYLYERAERKNDFKSQDEYLGELQHMKLADNTFNTFNEFFNINFNDVTNEVKEIKFECLRPAVEAYKKICQWGEYDLKYVRNIAIACEKNHTIEEITDAFNKICA